MGIPVLTQLYDEMRRLAIAGSVVAPGDFRLKKLVPLLEEAGKKAPVFVKLSEATSRLIESNEKTSAAALLELTTLVNAILYTQGATGIDAELVPIRTVDLGRPKTNAPARVLRPLQEALTTTGSGRLEVVREAYERGTFHDLRLIRPALAAIDDTYSEISDFVAEKILPLYGQAILPELQATFDPKGGSGHVRRLLLMHRLDPEATRPHLQRSLDEGSKEVRIAAIGCLGDSPEDIAYLLEQVRSRAKDVRAAALRALGGSHSDDAVKVLCEAIDGPDFVLAIEPIRSSRNRALTSYLLATTHKLFSALTGKEKDASKLGKQNERMCLILECLRGRDDEKSQQLLLNLFAQADRLASFKGEPSGKDVVERLVSVMATGPRKVQSALVDAHQALPAEYLGRAFVAACGSRKPAEVFELFSPYLTAKVNEKKKGQDPAYEKREALVACLVQGRREWVFEPESAGYGGSEAAPSLDPRWLDLSVTLGRLDLVRSLAVPGHAKANESLSRFFKERLTESGGDADLLTILSTMIRVAHPDATNAVIEAIKNRAKQDATHRAFWLGELIPRLPKAEALPKLEALLAALPEKMTDQLLDQVDKLKESK